jgi:hypothetical protein
LISRLPQKKLGDFTSTLNRPWNLEFAKKVTRGKYKFTRTMHPVQTKMQARAKSEKQEVEAKSKNQK